MQVRIRDSQLQVSSHNGWVFKQAAAGTWQPQMYDLIDRYVTDQTTFLDIGAWVGPIALYAAHKAKRVFAFEPDPIAFATLQQNLSLNPAITNLQIFQRAIGVRDGTVRLAVRVNPGDSTSSMLATGQDGWDVASQRLEKFCLEHQVEDPLFIKIDVEGYEYELLPALAPWLKHRRFIMHLSTHPHIIHQSIPDAARLSSLRKALAQRLATRRLSRAIKTLPVHIQRGNEATADRDLILLPRLAA